MVRRIIKNRNQSRPQGTWKERIKREKGNRGNCPRSVKEQKCSTTDPESGWFHKGEHKSVFAYSVETACDRHGWVLGFTVHPGNEHDSRTFKALYDKIKKFYPEMIVADSAYKTPAIAKLLIDDNIKPLFPYKRPMTKEGFFRKYEYVYDEYHDCYLCPENKILTYSTTNRDGYREYKSGGCANCPCLEKCTKSKDYVKVITRHIWEDYIEQCEDIRHGIGNKAIYNLRKETIERIFASAKEDHGFRYTQCRGKAQMNVKAALTFACMNLKKLARMLALREEKEQESAPFSSYKKEKPNQYLTTEKWLWSTCSTANFVYSLKPSDERVF